MGPDDADEEELVPQLRVPYVHATGFSVALRGGNDAGVVLPGEGSALSDRQRLAVAAQLGFSETVFVTSL